MRAAALLKTIGRLGLPVAGQCADADPSCPAVPGILKDLEARLMACGMEQKPSLWIEAQPAFAGERGKTVRDPDFDIDDRGPPRQRMALPANLWRRRE